MAVRGAACRRASRASADPREVQFEEVPGDIVSVVLAAPVHENEVEAGTMRPLDEGKPIHGEIVRLKPREESPALFDVEVQHDARPSTGRPAKVATDEYRKGWESIWADNGPDRTLN